MPIGVGQQAKTAPTAKALTTEQHELILQHKDLAYQMAKKLVRRRWLPAMLLKDELESVANLALCEAARRYDPARGHFPGLLHVTIRSQVAKASRTSQAVKLPTSLFDPRCKAKVAWCIAATDQEAGGDYFNPPGREAACDELDRAASRELWRSVLAALNRLPKRQREVLVLHCDGDGIREIGRRVGCSKETARKEVKKGIHALRQFLAIPST